MKTFRHRNHILAALTGFGILIIAVFLTFEGLKPEIQARILLVIIFMASVISAGFWIHELKEQKTAQLIVGNSILRLRTGTISNISGQTEKSEDIENTEVCISYFGILIGAKIIRFNQNGTLVKSVEIGQDYISISYGTDKKMQNAWLARPPIDPAELDSIAERFRYETGIMPRIIP